MSRLSLNDRAAIANMSTEYEATMGFFPVDHITLEYLKFKGRSNETVSCVLLSYVVSLCSSVCIPFSILFLPVYVLSTYSVFAGLYISILWCLFR